MINCCIEVEGKANGEAIKTVSKAEVKRSDWHESIEWGTKTKSVICGSNAGKIGPKDGDIGVLCSYSSKLNHNRSGQNEDMIIIANVGNSNRKADLTENTLIKNSRFILDICIVIVAPDCCIIIGGYYKFIRSNRELSSII